jgi:hypothetical protein
VRGYATDFTVKLAKKIKTNKNKKILEYYFNYYEQISKNPINIKMAGLQRSSISNSKLMI